MLIRRHCCLRDATDGQPASGCRRHLSGPFPTAAATILLTVLIKRAGPPFLSLVNYQVPVWAVIIGAVVLLEPLPGHFLIALMVILAGLALSQFYDRWRHC